MSESILIIESNTTIRDLLLGKEGVPEEIAYYQASFKARAWEGIQAITTEIVIFPLHFSEDRNFEGLWLAEKVLEKKFAEKDLYPKIIIVSHLAFERRQGIIKFFNHDVHAPYEKIDFIIPCLNGTCGCMLV